MCNVEEIINNVKVFTSLIVKVYKSFKNFNHFVRFIRGLNENINLNISKSDQSYRIESAFKGARSGGDDDCVSVRGTNIPTKSAFVFVGF